MAGKERYEPIDWPQQLNPQMLEELGRFYQRGNLPDRSDRLDVNRPLPADDYHDILPPPPARFQSDPPITGSPLFTRLASQLLNVDPRSKFNTTKIVYGPTPELVRLGRLFPLDKDAGFPDILQGYYGENSGEIGIHPEDRDAVRTLVHELAHGVGYKHPDIDETYRNRMRGTKEAENIFDMYYQRKPSQGTKDFQRQIRRWQSQPRAIQPSRKR